VRLLAACSQQGLAPWFWRFAFSSDGLDGKGPERFLNLQTIGYHRFLCEFVGKMASVFTKDVDVAAGMLPMAEKITMITSRLRAGGS
jgi:hypothetical protein